jgi:hypothetical protein
MTPYVCVTVTPALFTTAPPAFPASVMVSRFRVPTSPTDTCWSARAPAPPLVDELPRLTVAVRLPRLFSSRSIPSPVLPSAVDRSMVALEARVAAGTVGVGLDADQGGDQVAAALEVANVVRRRRPKCDLLRRARFRTSGAGAHVAPNSLPYF